MARKAKPKITEAKGFYAHALSQAEREKLGDARALEGLDEEIALLRVRLNQLAQEHPEKLELLLKGIGLLVRAVVVKYKLSPKAERDFYQSVQGVVESIGGALLPERFSNEV